jgi:hypothetical protein
MYSEEIAAHETRAVPEPEEVGAVAWRDALMEEAWVGACVGCSLQGNPMNPSIGKIRLSDLKSN